MPSHATPATSSWTTYDQNGLRTGVDASGASFSPPTAAWTSPALDGSLFGQPLIYANRVFAATENDTIYALAADTGAVLWSKHLATPFSPSTVPGICGDIDPTVGITGTPVIDTARDEIFVVATEQVPGGASHHLDRARPLHRGRRARRGHRPGRPWWRRPSNCSGSPWP